jgi:hypothetical protein
MEVSLIREINDSIQNWENISEGNKLQVIRKLKSIAKIEKCAVPKDPELSCPEYKYQLSSPCNLSQCEFYINNPQSFNCIYHSLDEAKKKRLTANDVSACLGSTVSTVNGLLNGAIQKIRVVRLEEEITASRPNRFQYLEGHCVHCGMTIEDELDLGSNPNLLIEHGKFGYCSDACKREKPVWKFKLEKKFCTDWEYVIFRASQYLNVIKASHKDIESMLGVDPASLNAKDKEKVQKYKKAYGLD